MKTKYCFEIMNLDDEMVAVPVGAGADQFRGVLKVNETGAAILKLLAADTTKDAVVDALMKEYSGERTEIAAFVHEYIAKLAIEGIVE